MKNLVITFYTLFLSFSLPLYAQQDLKSYDLRISYEVDFQQDSTRQTKKQESMFLFVKDGNSFFQSANEYYKDSLMHRKEVYGESVNTGKYRSEFKFTINKTSSGDIRVVDAIDDNYFRTPKGKMFLTGKCRPTPRPSTDYLAKKPLRILEDGNGLPGLPRKFP